MHFSTRTALSTHPPTPATRVSAPALLNTGSGLRAVLNRRRKLLSYLRRSNFPRYAFVIHSLGLKDVYAKQVRAWAVLRGAGRSGRGTDGVKGSAESQEEQEEQCGVWDGWCRQHARTFGCVQGWPWLTRAASWL